MLNAHTSCTVMSFLLSSSIYIQTVFKLAYIFLLCCVYSFMHFTLALPDQCLEVAGCSSLDGLECQHHNLELDAGCNRKPVEVTEEGGHMG